MDRGVATELVDAFEKHFLIAQPNKNLFIDVLANCQVLPDSSRFYEELSEHRQTIPDSEGRYHELSLRRVLRNRNAENYKLSGMKKLYGGVLTALGIYSSDDLTRNIRSTPELAKLMADCELPFSLLGKFETWDSSNKEERMFVKRRPVLVIPSAHSEPVIDEWESANTVYEIESGLLRTMKRISRERYLQG